jgi:hypothetical protein
MTMWGDRAKEDDAQWQGNPVLGVKKCKVRVKKLGGG